MNAHSKNDLPPPTKDGGRRRKKGPREERGGRKGARALSGRKTVSPRAYTTARERFEKTPPTCHAAAFSPPGRKNATEHRRGSFRSTTRLGKNTGASRIRGRVRRTQCRRRPLAAALLDAVGALIERLGPAISGGRVQGRCNDRGQSQRPGRAFTAYPSTVFDPHMSHDHSPAPGRRGEPGRRGVPGDSGVGSLTSSEQRDKAPHRRCPASGGEARARNEEKGVRGRKAEFGRSRSEKWIVGTPVLLPRPHLPAGKNRPDSPGGPFRRPAEKRPQRSRNAPAAVYEERRHHRKTRGGALGRRDNRSPPCEPGRFSGKRRSA
jgi:hypothetical protein